MDVLLSRLNEFYTFVAVLLKENPVVAGVVSLWGLGVITFLFYRIPLRVWYFIKRQCTTSMVLNNQDDIFYQMLKWLSVNKIHSFIRTFNFSHSSYWGYGDSVMTYGYGGSFFFYKGSIVFITRDKQDASATVHTKETIHLRILGRRRNLFAKLFEDVKKKQEKDTYSVYHYKDNAWHNFCSVPRRRLETISIPKVDKKKLINHINEFREQKQWYFDNGIPYKTGILLYGPPGTGKTSLVSSICSEFKKHCYIINLGQLSDSSLKNALASVPRGHVVLMEDIDTILRGTSLRDLKEGPEFIPADIIGCLTLGGVLNALDGIACGTDRIVVATTNHIEKLDEALKREGRFDIKIKLDYMTDETLFDYIKRLYPSISETELHQWHVNDKVAPCQVQQLVFENRMSPLPVLEKVAYKDNLVNTDQKQTESVLSRR